MRALLLALVLLGGAQTDVASRQAAAPAERLRERLRDRPESERARLEHNLELLERMPAATRAKLLERARVLRERERAFEAAVRRELRQRLQERGVVPGSAAAGELWRAWLRESLRERGREVHERLPKELRRRLEHAPPELRRRYLERLVEERERVARRALAEMRDRYGLPPREVRRLELLPLPERLKALRELDEGAGNSPR